MNLKNISDKILLKEISKLVHEEREILGKVLWHLKEIDQRKLYSDLQCKSLFDYCVKVLKYSEGQASRRVSACRMLAEIPELEKPINSGELNITQINLAKNFFSDEKITDTDTKKEILAKIKGKTTRKTEQILWDLKKESGPRKIWISLNEETVERIETVKGMKAHVARDTDTFLMKAMDEVETLWTPKHHRGHKQSSDTRFIPALVRAEVWARDEGKCINCGSNFAVEYDHILPFSMGGKTETKNLQLLCRNCNQRKGLIQFGSKRSSGPNVRGKI